MALLYLHVPLLCTALRIFSNYTQTLLSGPSSSSSSAAAPASLLFYLFIYFLERSAIELKRTAVKSVPGKELAGI